MTRNQPQNLFGDNFSKTLDKKCSLDWSVTITNWVGSRGIFKKWLNTDNFKIVWNDPDLREWRRGIDKLVKRAEQEPWVEFITFNQVKCRNLALL